MFSYNCEKCGREVPPAYSECPDCAAKAKAAAPMMPAAPQVPTQVAPQPSAVPYQPQYQMTPPPQQMAPPQQYIPQAHAPIPQMQPPPAQPQHPPQQMPPQQMPPQQMAPPQYAPQQMAPPQQQYAPQQYEQYAPQQQMAPPQPTVQSPYLPPAAPKSSGFPSWAIAPLVAVVLGLGGYILIDKVIPSRSGRDADVAAASSASEAASESSSSRGAGAASAGGQTKDAKFLQVTGLRITEANKKPQISMVVVNHASAELVDVKTTVLIHTTKDAPGAAPLAKLELKLGAIGPNEVRDITMPFPTKLRAYELPDWQFLTAQLESGE